MSITLTFKYQKIAEDLVLAKGVLMDLYNQSCAIAVQVEFAVRDAVQLASSYKERFAKGEVSLLDWRLKRVWENNAFHRGRHIRFPREAAF
jgi:hypothetical protein